MSSENSIYLLFLLVIVSLILEITGEKICQNSGTLLKNGTCLCTSDYQGETCETRKNDHNTDWKTRLGLPDCKHGRVDVASNLEYVCECWENWEGELCDLPICKNGGTPINGTCECYGNWAGQHCEKIDCDEYRKWSKSKKLCVCKKKGWEGVRCHLPICKQGTRVIDSNGTGSCECWKPERWFGELCDQSIYCHKQRGEPYFDRTEMTPKCRCKKGWTGEDCSTKDCHGHGKPDYFGRTCICDEHFSIFTDCATCMYGYGGENCEKKVWGVSSGGGSSSNYGSGSSYDDEDDEDDDTSIPLIAILIVVPIVAVCVIVHLKKLLECSEYSSPSRPYYSQAAVTSPLAEHLRQPQCYRTPSPTDPRAPANANLLANYSTNGHGNFSSSLRVPIPSQRTTTYWRVQENGLDVRPTVHDPPPPAYNEVTEEALPPSYEEVVKPT